MKTRTRKGLALLLSAAMIVSMLALPVLAEEQSSPSFPDVAGHWAEGSIDRWAVYGIVKGDEYGKANPDSQLTRGELAQIFVNLFGLTTVAKNTYADLKGSEWYADAILKCTAAGILQGDGTSSRAAAPITRQEVMVMFGRAMGVIAPADPDLSGFTDGDKVADWAAGYMAALAKLGIVTGSGDGSVAPANNIDRASLLALLDKAVVEYVTEPGKANVNNANGFVIVNVPGEGTVTLTGTISGVVVAAGTRDAEVAASGLTAATVKVDSSAALSVGDASKLSNLTLNAPAPVEIARGSSVGTLAANASAEIINNGSITALTANAAVKMNNRGSIAKAQINADGVILDGTRPSSMVVAEGTKNPTDSNGKEIKPDGTGGGSSGGGDSPSVTYADIVKAPLVDQSGAITSDLVQNYNVVGIVSGNTVNVTITGNHLMKHHNANNTYDYWIGFGILAKEGNEYYAGFGSVPDSLGSPLSSVKDRTYEENGKTYNTVYFGLLGEDLTKGAYVVVKNGENTTTYNVTFKVELAPNFEDMKTWIVKDEESYNQLPSDYTAAYPWDEKYSMDGENAAGLPWLAVVYDSNVADGFTFTITKDNHPVTIQGISSGTNTVNKERYQLWHMATPAETEGKDYLEQLDPFGTYAVTLTKGDLSETKTVEYLDPTAEYVKVQFVDGSNPATVYQTINVKKGTAVGAPATPEKTGYSFEKWVTRSGESETDWDPSTLVTAATTVYAKWTAMSYTITYIDGSNSENPVAYTIETDTITLKDPAARVGYDFDGWYNGEVKVTEIAKGSTGDLTLTAKWIQKVATTPEILNDLLGVADITEITISGTIGSTEKYEVYAVDRALTTKGGTVCGPPDVNADGVTFDGVTINNKGDGAGGAHRNGINAYASRLSIKNCTFNSGTEFANGLMILPRTAETVYSITNNTFNGYANGDGSWSTSAILISSGYSMEQKPFFDAETGAVSAATNLDNTADLNIIQGNFFNNCQNDYTRNDYTDGTVIYCTSNSATDNFRLSSGAAGSKFYVTGNVTRHTDTTVPEGAELIVAEGKTLTIPENVTLTVEGTLTVNGTLVVNGTLTVTDTGTLNGTGTFPTP